MALIGIDLDDTTFEFVNPLLAKYRERYGHELYKTDITNYDTRRFLVPECKNLFNEFITDEFIESSTPFKNSVDCINQLHRRHQLLFVTSGHPETIAARNRLLSRTFDWYDQGMLVRTCFKSKMGLDILIDDCITNFLGFQGMGIMFTQPWNEHFSSYNVKRVSDWYEIEDYLT